MSELTLSDLQVSVQDTTAFHSLDDYLRIGREFLAFLARSQPVRIVSPSHPNYIFYQYEPAYGHKITRPLNTNLWLETVQALQAAFDDFRALLDDLKQRQEAMVDSPGVQALLASKLPDKVVYTIQQSVGCIGDSFENANQSRKRIGQLFENLVKLIIQAVGIECEPRTITLPIPGYPGYEMSYELDLVFSRSKVILAAETSQLDPQEVVGSVKTTSKDRLDKVFLDKFLLSRLLGRTVPVVAIFLHDVQRAQRGNSIFGINSTFKSQHFLGYTVALNSLDGVYYVDPRPEMLTDARLSERIGDFQQFLVRDLWYLTRG